MENVLAPLLGGMLIGIASSFILFVLGRITGISGILAGSFINISKDAEAWKYSFIVGLILGGLSMKIIQPDLFDYELIGSYPVIILAGLLVGFGTRLGSGCTSGHGVCGLPRGSIRSIIATVTFMGVGILTVLIKGLI